jgi:hypothetical protein
MSLLPTDEDKARSKGYSEGYHDGRTDVLKELQKENSEIARKEKKKVLDELKTDLKTRFIAEGGNQWVRGRNSGLIECCNIIDEHLQGGEQ